jgi:hypothetical protein
MTPEDVAVLEQLAPDHTIAEIAQALDLPAKTVRDAADARGVAFKPANVPVTLPEVYRIRRLVSLGFSSEMIAATLNISLHRVQGIRARCEIRRPKLPCAVHTRVTQRCWDRLVEAAAAHGPQTYPNRIAGVVLEVATDAPALLPHVLRQPPPAPPASMAGICVQIELRGCAG